jgi:hypothetical protein
MRAGSNHTSLRQFVLADVQAKQEVRLAALSVLAEANDVVGAQPGETHFVQKHRRVALQRERVAVRVTFPVLKLRETCVHAPVARDDVLAEARLVGMALRHDDLWLLLGGQPTVVLKLLPLAQHALP